MAVAASAQHGSAADPLQRKWQGDAAALFALSQQSHALTLIDAALRAAGRGDPHYWFPAYFCESGLPALRARTSRIRFYPVTEAMTPDWDACVRLARERPPDLFTLPHLFGVENETGAAREFCDTHGALLHEDCAHVLLAFGNAGKLADFVSFSPRKFFDIPDGGLLAVRGSLLAGQATDAARRLGPARNRPLRWRFDRWRENVGLRRKRGPVLLAGLDTDTDRQLLFSDYWMSAFAERQLGQLIEAGTLEPFAAARRSAQANMRRHLRDLPGLRALSAHPQAVPHWSGWRGRDPATAQRILAELRRSGLVVNGWPGLPPEVKAEPHRYGAALQIRRTLLRVTFPQGRLPALNPVAAEVQP